MWEALFEVLVDLFSDLILQLLFEAGCEAGSHTWNRVTHRPTHENPVLAAIGYGLMGSIAGLVSLWIIPHPMIRFARFRGIGVVVTPVLAALAMSAIGHARRERGTALVRLDTFAYAYVFALAMALVRFAWAS